jgi:hypothetical protein
MHSSVSSAHERDFAYAGTRTARTSYRSGGTRRPVCHDAPMYADAPIQRAAAGNAIEYAYRALGEGDVPLVLLQQFRGNLAFLRD